MSFRLLYGAVITPTVEADLGSQSREDGRFSLQRAQRITGHPARVSDAGKQGG